ncbi:MAG: DUF4129 domain-containing protein [Bacillota bacterium]|jgi:hypothetical protein
MQKASTYLPWSKATGSALLIGVPAYLWASWLGLSRHVPAFGWQTVLASSLAIPFVFLVWADRSSGSEVLRKAYLGITGLCLSAAALPFIVKRYAPLAQIYGLFTVTLAVVSLIWQRDRSPSAWQRKALWAFVVAAVPSIAGGTRAVPPHPSLLFLSLLMIAGVTLCLTGNDEDATGHYSARRLASIAALLFLLGWIALSLAPGASSVASLGIRGILVAIRTVILEVTKPLGFVIGWLINFLLAAIRKRGQETESPLNPLQPPEHPELAEEHAVSEVWAIVGWVLVAVFIALALRAIWRLLEKYAARTRVTKEDESRSSEYSASRAARWAVDKIRELGGPLASMISRRFRRRTEEDPLVAMYDRFLTLAEASGHARVPSQTPLEFSRSLGEKMPDASSHIERITRIFVSRFYANRPATPEELSSLRESLAAFESAVANEGAR